VCVCSAFDLKWQAMLAEEAYLVFNLCFICENLWLKTFKLS